MSRQSFIASLIGLPRKVSLQQIVRDVSRAYGVPMTDILSRKRDQETVVPRQEAMRRARLAGMTTGDIGRAFGRDHTTVNHSIKRAEARL